MSNAQENKAKLLEIPDADLRIGWNVLAISLRSIGPKTNYNDYGVTVGQSPAHKSLSRAVTPPFYRVLSHRQEDGSSNEFCGFLRYSL